jgi:hypothetical protein
LKTIFHRTQIIAVLLMLLCLILALIPFESNAGAQLGHMLRITLTVYAIARGLNAVISAAQGTELSIEPMGVGLTLTPGEILDPLNDLIEQFSSVLLPSFYFCCYGRNFLTDGLPCCLRWC